MDKIEEFAHILTSYCTGVEPGDDVLVYGPLHAEDLLVALHEAIGRRGGRPLFVGWHGRSRRAYLEAADPDDVDTPRHGLAAVETADVVIAIRGTENPHETADVDERRLQAYGQAQSEIRATAQATRGVATCYPDRAGAQEARMSYDDYRDFVLDAVTVDWHAQRDRQENVATRLEEGSTVRLVSEGTDLEMEIGPMGVVNEAGSENLPGGEVYTAPVVESVRGTVTFDVPTIVRGQEVCDASLTFEDGRVVDYDVARGEAALASVLDTDEGARRVGELGVGMNPHIDRYTRKTLFDEKMNGTVHLALGDAYEEVVPDGVERNESAAHLDLVIDTTASGELLVDDEALLRDGTFFFEDGFSDAGEAA